MSTKQQTTEQDLATAIELVEAGYRRRKGSVFAATGSNFVSKDNQFVTDALSGQQSLEESVTRVVNEHPALANKVKKLRTRWLSDLVNLLRAELPAGDTMALSPQLMTAFEHAMRLHRGGPACPKCGDSGTAFYTNGGPDGRSLVG